MGSFSWCYCDQGVIPSTSDGYPNPKKEQRLRSFITECPVSVLFPKEFGGKDAQIDVDEYLDFGRFGSEDIYNLVADWNREWISMHLDFTPPHSIAYSERYPEYPAKPVKEYFWWPFYSDLSLVRDEVEKRLKEIDEHFEYRNIGIDIACYDEDNAALPYPIKIAKDSNSVYEDCPPSIGDPGQGW